jgi:hypothetical protein
MDPLLSMAIIWPTKSLGMKMANGKISVLINCTTFRERTHTQTPEMGRYEGSNTIQRLV